MPQKPTIVATKVIAESRFFQIEALDLCFANGEKRVFERINGKHKHGSVMVIPMLDAETVLLVKEYGAGVQDYFLSLPKGLVDEGESLPEAANREMMEEIGYAAKDLSKLTTLYVSPGYMGSNITVFVARNLYPQALVGDEPEEIEIVKMKLSDINQLDTSEMCCDSRTIAALYILREKLDAQA